MVERRGETKLPMEQGKEFGFPVKYAEHPNIWIAWEIWRREFYDSYHRKRVPSCPVGQLVITRDKELYDKDGRFKDGYNYFWISCTSGEWVKLNRDEFHEKEIRYANYIAGTGGMLYNVKEAYSAIPIPPFCPKDTYKDYKKYLAHYYPDYGREDCSVYVIWNNDNLPIVQIRAEAVGSEVKFDIAYPGDKEYTPLHHPYIALDMEALTRRKLARVVQVHPAEYFGDSFPPSERHEKFNPNLNRRRITWSWEWTHSLGERYVSTEEIELTWPW